MILARKDHCHRTDRLINYSNGTQSPFLAANPHDQSAVRGADAETWLGDNARFFYVSRPSFDLNGLRQMCVYDSEAASTKLTQMRMPGDDSEPLRRAPGTDSDLFSKSLWIMMVLTPAMKGKKKTSQWDRMLPDEPFCAIWSFKSVHHCERERERERAFFRYVDIAYFES